MTHITIEKAKLEQILEALYGFIPYLPVERDKEQCAKYDSAITTIKQACALDKMAENARVLGLDYEPAQEPVAWTGCGECDSSFPCHEGRTACMRNVESECASPSLTSGERTEYEARIKRLGEMLTLQYESGERLAAQIMELEEATTPPAVAPAKERMEVLDRIKEALPEFRQQDDYLLAHGASLLSEQSHEIIHIDTALRIAGDTPPAAPVQPAQEPSQREFENWLRSKWTAGYTCQKLEGRYTDKAAQSFWECWQAAHGVKEKNT